MSIEKFVDIALATTTADWNDKNKEAFEALFGGNGGRYPLAAKKEVALRAPEMNSDSGVQYSAIIHSSNPTSGMFGGPSFVMFPSEGHSCLIGLGIGTQGLSPDERILGRPGHARKAQAISRWLNSVVGKGNQVSWAKFD